LLSFVRFNFQFSSIICLFAPLAVKIFFIRESLFIFSLGKIVSDFLVRKIFYAFIVESLFIVFTKENCLCFSNLHIECIKVKLINLILFLYSYFF